MTLDRRKVLIYLRPDISASERFADAKIEAHHRGDRGDMSRTALLAGLALGEVDSRLPSMLAALLAEDTPPETLSLTGAGGSGALTGAAAGADAGAEEAG
ncbi:plasmid partitioning/stability family protein [Klebsiella aerogenes]|uniref:plasmid partitioning/stability family protein n=1 Tax=Klebsiella aerogenes TaxID=548 RepID=UPI000931724C